MPQLDAWLRGPLAGVDPMLMLPATPCHKKVFGLLCHIAEHTQLHTGQVITAAKIVGGLGLR